ncbi:hypothetical protein F511_18142 [Dorcoceras hygrometricum]|uniref:Uncharacterized protein n=1 Tax=Dorcoceras hygrometricum TaxID=472368 RepID=A0A2Z7AAJ6_9LAMI|nr:hypothetical protein F511_18142 [Dorcoceras hygrometricum]
MGCPGQARTKPRISQPSQRCWRHRRTVAAATKSRAELGRTLVATRAARPRQGGAQPRPTIATMLCNRQEDRATSSTTICAGQWPAIGRYARQARISCAQRRTCVTLNGSGIQLAVDPQPLWLRNHNFGLAHRIMVKRLATSPHDPLGITDSACKNQLVVVKVQYGPFNTYIPIRSTTIGKSRVAKDPIAMHTSWRSNSDIASVTSIGYPRMKASGESSTTKHRLLLASGPHPIPPPNDPNGAAAHGGAPPRAVHARWPRIHGRSLGAASHSACTIGRRLMTETCAQIVALIGGWPMAVECNVRDDARLSRRRAALCRAQNSLMAAAAAPAMS